MTRTSCVRAKLIRYMPKSGGGRRYLCADPRVPTMRLAIPGPRQDEPRLACPGLAQPALPASAPSLAQLRRARPASPVHCLAVPSLAAPALPVPSPAAPSPALPRSLPYVSGWYFTRLTTLNRWTAVSGMWRSPDSHRSHVRVETWTCAAASEIERPSLSRSAFSCCRLIGGILTSPASPRLVHATPGPAQPASPASLCQSAPPRAVPRQALPASPYAALCWRTSRTAARTPANSHRSSYFAHTRSSSSSACERKSARRSPSLITSTRRW